MSRRRRKEGHRGNKGKNTRGEKKMGKGSREEIHPTVSRLIYRHTRDIPLNIQKFETYY